VIESHAAAVDSADMVRKGIAAGLAGLGLIGGAGSVVYNNNGDATVKVKNDRTGKVESVQLHAGGRSFSCPAGTRDKVEPHDLELGRIQLTLRQVRGQERKLERQYPNHRAPDAVVDQYNALVRRDNRLVDVYNAEVDTRNAILDRDCTSG
jgi:hypothetical protein